MAAKRAPAPAGNLVSVHGLEHGREHARRHAGRRRRKNAVVSGLTFLVVGGVVGGAGYYLWQFYVDEQERDTTDTVVPVQRSAEEWIEELEDTPRWNGPGAPAFGVGQDEP